MKEVMEGRKPIEDLDAGIRSAIRIDIYRAACAVLEHEDKTSRKTALARIPARIRPHIEAEARRIWEMRKSDKT